MYYLTEVLRTHINSLLVPTQTIVNGYMTFVCPFCRNGTGSTKDGIATKDGSHYTCFVCGFYGDLFDYISERDNIPPKKIHAHIAELLIAQDINPNAESTIIPIIDTTLVESVSETKNQIDYLTVYNEAIQNIAKAENYLQSRGISVETAKKYTVGYSSDWLYPNSKKNKAASERVLFFRTEQNYTARATDVESSYPMLKVGKSGLFPLQVIESEFKGVTDIFVVEGEFDALSFYEIGESAIALGSTSNIDLLYAHVEVFIHNNINLFISLDNDKAGDLATNKLISKLENTGVAFNVVNVSGDYNDPNECLVKDKKFFIQSVEAVIENKGHVINESNTDTSLVPTNKDNTDTDYLQFEKLFTQSASKLEKNMNYCTGFKKLDSFLKGLQQGLYVLGAIPSLGKTTLVHQLTEQLVVNNDVCAIYFSLEQSEIELVSKSINRYIHAKNSKSPVSMLDIRLNKNDEEINSAKDFYFNNVYKNYKIYAVEFENSLDNIKSKVIEFKTKQKRAPIVVIDYLQIIKDFSKPGIKESIDYILTNLKKFSLEEDLVIIVVSSLNRANYLAPVSFESFKESGSIEYTADVVWGLQFTGLAEINSDANIYTKRKQFKVLKDENPRKLELVCLKNRFGDSSYEVEFKYYPQFDLFVEK